MKCLAVLTCGKMLGAISVELFMLPDVLLGAGHTYTPQYLYHSF